jgi:hypothetical protein
VVGVQDLIEEALYEVYGDYDMSKSIQTRAVAIHQDGFHRAISLRDADGLLGHISGCEPAHGTVKWQQGQLHESKII